MDSIVLYSILAVVLLVGAVLAVIVFQKRKKAAPKIEPFTGKEVAEELAPAIVVVEKTKEPGLSEKLSKTRGSLAGRLGKFFLGTEKKELFDKDWEEIEETLLEGDVGIQTTTLLLSRVREKIKSGNGQPLRDLFQTESEGLLGDLEHGAKSLEGVPKPYVISIVGVNGVGKTTTIGKLAGYFVSQGKTVLLGAADTFRAGAIAQLKIWSDRVGTEFVTGREGADPGAVSFDSVTAAKARGIEIVLLDTAGRLHTKSNLMEELKKIDRVIKKVIPEAPHETWLVVDGTLGQNSIQQAREFQKTLNLTGVIVTKLDGTAKGGAVLAIASELKLPIRFIGVGESVKDLMPFSPKPFIEAILGTS